MDRININRSSNTSINIHAFWKKKYVRIRSIPFIQQGITFQMQIGKNKERRVMLDIRLLIFCQCLYFRVYDTPTDMWQTLEALVSAKNFLNTRAEHEAMEPCLSNTVDSYINFSSSQYLSIWWHSFQYLLQDASFPTPLLSANFPFIYRNAREHISHPW